MLKRISIILSVLMLSFGSIGVHAYAAVQPVDTVQPYPVEDFVDVTESETTGSIQSFSSADTDLASISSEPVAGQKTLRNFLATALEPCGQTLYVWGGGWNSSDAAAGIDAKTIGVSPTWKSFFLAHAGNYHYENYKYQNRKGLDCSGFVGWTVYNTMESTSGNPGYVLTSTKMASNYASRGWGTYYVNSKVTSYKAGDIVSLNGHVWICLGQCSDGSILLIHSTTNAGVQISGTIASNGASNSQAYQIASKYMKQYFPYWSKYYSAKCCGSTYFTGNVMRWNLTSGVLSDPDNIRSLNPEEVLKALLGNRPIYKSYVDLPENAWYIEPVSAALEEGFMVGTSPGIFSPDSTITRAQIAQVLYNSCEDKTAGEQEILFSDVAASAWYAAAIKWASSNGIVNGYGDSKFGPDDNVTREQLAVMLYNYKGNPSVSGSFHGFEDSGQVSDWAKDAMLWATQNGIINGSKNGSKLYLNPQGKATRAETAAMMINYLK